MSDVADLNKARGQHLEQLAREALDAITERPSHSWFADVGDEVAEDLRRLIRAEARRRGTKIRTLRPSGLRSRVVAWDDTYEPTPEDRRHVAETWSRLMGQAGLDLTKKKGE